MVIINVDSYRTATEVFCGWTDKNNIIFYHLKLTVKTGTYDPIKNGWLQL